jgi:hypothetical protein
MQGFCAINIMLGDRIRGTSVSEYLDTPPNKPENLIKYRPFCETGSRLGYPEILHFTEF